MTITSSPQSAVAMSGGRVGLTKAVEYMWQEFGRDVFASVDGADFQFAVDRIELSFDYDAPWREVDYR